ncbi:MAG: PIN domain-containing protein [Candidatus Latescibacteria bacterium]|nr:PIN domain-containing protein [Candidatus Latescibacterota bacterium]
MFRATKGVFPTPARAALRYRASGLGFSDLMILAAAERSGAHPLYTFDKKAARTDGVKLL